MILVSIDLDPYDWYAGRLRRRREAYLATHPPGTSDNRPFDIKITIAFPDGRRLSGTKDAEQRARIKAFKHEKK
jgi:hypothetical protein